MKRIKTVQESEFHSRKVVMPEQINPNGTLFGGVLMSWVDKLAFMTAQRHSENNHVVTVNIEQLSFKKPIRMGDHVLLHSRLMRVGKSSMDIQVIVEREDGRLGNPELATRAILTFVAVDSAGKPATVPALKIRSKKDIALHTEALIRNKIRTRFDGFLSRLEKAPPLFRFSGRQASGDL